MIATASTPSVAPALPANPTQGHLRGQTTLVAEIGRWQALATQLAAEIGQMPGLQDQLTQLQTRLAGAIAVRDLIHTLHAEMATVFTQRKQLHLDGGGLFSRLSLALQSVHGPTSPRLLEYGLKPRRPLGRPRKTVPPPLVEVTTTHPSATA